MRKPRGILVVGLVVALTALAPASVLAKAGGTDRPVKGTTVGAVTVTLVPGLPTEVEATGVMTHLGRFTGLLEGSSVIIGGTCSARAPSPWWRPTVMR
jgi:hypothetical protein